MSNIKADNFTWKTGEATAQSGTTVTGSQVVYGVAKSWINFNGASPTTRASFNFSSVTRNATGDYTLSFTSSLIDANYSQSADVSAWYATQWPSGPTLNTTTSSATEQAPTSSNFRIFIYTISGGYDPKYFNIAIFR